MPPACPGDVYDPRYPRRAPKTVNAPGLLGGYLRSWPTEMPPVAKDNYGIRYGDWRCKQENVTIPRASRGHFQTFSAVSPEYRGGWCGKVTVTKVMIQYEARVLT